MGRILAVLSLLLAVGCTLTTQAPQDDPIPTTIVIEETDEPVVDVTDEVDDDDSVDGPFTDGRPTTIPANNGNTGNNGNSGNSGNSGNNGNNLPPCSPRSDWPTYVVVAGDTLANIAQRSNSSVSALAQANCMNNPNAISVGQVLRVPRIPTPRVRFNIGQVAQVTVDGDNLRVRSQPGTGFQQVGQLVTRTCVTITGGPTTANGYSWWQIQGPRGMNGWVADAGDGQIWLSNQYQDCLPFNAGPGQLETFNCLDSRWRVIGSSFPTLSPALGVSNQCYQIAAGANVTVAWPAAPTTATKVTFYRRSDNSTRADVIGVDNNGADGFSIQYVVPGGLPPSAIFAQAEAGIVPGALVESDFIGFYTSEAFAECPGWIQVSNPVVQISPTNGFDGRCYQLTNGSTITLSYPDAQPGAIEVTFYRNNPVLTRADVMGIDSDPSDGFSIQVTVGSWAASDIYARSHTGEQASERESGHVGVIVTN